MSEYVTASKALFDEIRRTDPKGREHWSARDMQEAMGYEKWEHFAKVVRRALKAAENTGTQVDQAFSRIQEKLPGGTKPREEYLLSRYAAYLVAMNGDPNKPQVAAAQAYFATRTRQAEIAPTAQSVSLEEFGPISDVRVVHHAQTDDEIVIDGQHYYTVQAYYRAHPEWPTFSLTAMLGMVRYVCWGLEGHQKMTRVPAPKQPDQEGMYPEAVFLQAHRMLLALRGRTQCVAAEALQEQTPEILG